MVGLALDYCVHATALAAASRGYVTYIVQDACRGIEDLSNSKRQGLAEAGVKVISSGNLEELLTR